jgi:hypothetical protein
LCIGAAAWHAAPRDQFIGWERQQRERSLHHDRQHRSLFILPWVHSKNLASKILGMISRQLPDDWENGYGIRPVLMESFVETDRFTGTCYKAANWIYIGKTKDRESSVPLESKAYHQGLVAFSSPPPLQTVSNSVMLLGMGWPNIYCRVSINYFLYMSLFEKERWTPEVRQLA